MTGHLNDGQLLAYLEDNLAPQYRESASAHLRTCPACRARTSINRGLLSRS